MDTLAIYVAHMDARQFFSMFASDVQYYLSWRSQTALACAGLPINDAVARKTLSAEIAHHKSNYKNVVKLVENIFVNERWCGEDQHSLRIYNINGFPPNWEHGDQTCTLHPHTYGCKCVSRCVYSNRDGILYLKVWMTGLPLKIDLDRRLGVNPKTRCCVIAGKSWLDEILFDETNPYKKQDHCT